MCAVYLDWLMHHGGSGFFKGKKSCHMFADTLEELHEMAEKIGMRRAWFQDNGRTAQHYDLVASRRAAAIKHGALQLTSREQVCYFIDLSRRRCVTTSQKSRGTSSSTVLIVSNSTSIKTSGQLKPIKLICANTVSTNGSQRNTSPSELNFQNDSFSLWRS